MKTQFVLTVYNDSTKLDFMNMYSLEMFCTFDETIEAALAYNLPWQISKVSEYIIEDSEIELPFPKCETYFTIEPECDNWYNYDMYHSTLHSARNEAARCIKNEHCNCIIKQLHEVIVSHSNT